MKTFEKQPVDKYDYDVNFSRWLAGINDTASSAVVTNTLGITKITDSLSAGVVKVWVTGGASGQTYTFTINLTTTGGRIKQYEFAVKVRDR
jgi:hypothetical protein